MRNICVPSGCSSNRSSSASVGLTPSDKMADIKKFLYKNPLREYRFPSKIKKSPSDVISPPIALQSTNENRQLRFKRLWKMQQKTDYQIELF